MGSANSIPIFDCPCAQGTTAPLAQWEPSLKQNLSLAAHCAQLEPRITENVAILANTDQWWVLNGMPVELSVILIPMLAGT